MMPKEGDSYYTFIESSVRRYYNSSFDVLHGVSTEANKAASHAWRSVLGYTNLVGLAHDNKKEKTASSLLVRALNRGPSISSSLSFASRSIGVWKDFATSSMRFSRSGTSNPSPLIASPTLQAKALNIPSDEPDLDPIHLSSIQKALNKNETASLLAMGTLYSLRDTTLIQAMDLLQSLRFWLERWENPMLSFIEAGPMIWFSPLGYNHQTMVGEKITLIQTLLAKLCYTIGEIQQHLIQAGWQLDFVVPCNLGQFHEWMIGRESGYDSDEEQCTKRMLSKLYPKIQESTRPWFYSSSDFVVESSRGRNMKMNDTELALWCIDAIKLSRDQMIKIAGEGGFTRTLPFSEHWPLGSNPWQVVCADKNEKIVPLWATASSDTSPKRMITNSVDEGVDISMTDPTVDIQPLEVNIHDLQTLSTEVASLLDSMAVMHNQQMCKLGQLRPPTRLARNWYVIVLGLPLASYTLYKIVKEQMNSKLLPEIINQVVAFCEEHFFDPMRSIYRELFTVRGREDVTDRKARYHAIAILKQMIQSWLVDTYPNISIEEASEKANQMDISLIEQKKEESIKNILELNNIIRMSMIEMQFIKKELMNALYSIDELMGSNEINVRLAAMTPAFILFSSIRYVFRYLFYALLKLGRSKEQTYESVRLVVLDLERLLMMRDNALITYGENDAHQQVLGPEDLGLLILLIYECRQILQQSRRRFRLNDVKNISEDLSELAGDRGRITIRQQIQIISRMTRTYAFLTAR